MNYKEYCDRKEEIENEMEELENNLEQEEILADYDVLYWINMRLGMLNAELSELNHMEIT